MKQYLVIGGSSGIGAALVQQLKASGYHTTATYNESKTIESKGINYVHFDVLDPNSTLEIPEVLDGVVYCPGRINLKPFHRLTKSDFALDYEVQVLGAIDVIQQALPSLKKSESPSIVLFSTVAVQTGFTFHSTVSASKGAIEGLTRSLAAEFSPKVRVNAIAPSITKTSLTEGLLSNDAKIEANEKRHPLNKIGTAGDVANLAYFLLTDKSSWMTGQVLHLDGGISTIK